jgi:hypothetical protein
MGIKVRRLWSERELGDTGLAKDGKSSFAA